MGLQPHKKGGGFFLVDGRSASEGEYPARPIRIKVTGTEGGVAATQERWRILFGRW